MFRYVMRPTRPQGLPWAVLSVAACFQAAPLTQWRPPQGLKLRSVMLSGLLLQPLLRLLHRLLRLPSWLTPGLCSILFLTGWQGLPWAVLSAEVSLLAALMTQWRPPQGLTLPIRTSWLPSWQGLLFLPWRAFR